MSRFVLLVATLFGAAAVVAVPRTASTAEPVRIGISTILSGPFADRGQSEQYGAQVALDQINQAGGVLGRPVEAFYADNACKPEIGVPATRRLIEQQHVPVIIGALCTPVTHAIEPMVQAAKLPLVIATSAGQDFVDASGVSGNDYLFKTIPSEFDIARGLIRFLKPKHVTAVAILAEAGGFPQANAVAMARAAADAGMKVTAQETITPGSTDLAALLDKVKAGAPDELLIMPGSSTAAFFKAYEASGWKVPLSGRFDFATAMGAVSPAFRDAGGLANMTDIVVFSPLINRPGVQAFVASYQAHYGLVPTQRSFFVYEAAYLVVDAIRRAHADTPAVIEKALKATKMPSRLGGTYAPDDHNHAHTPLFVTGLRDGKAAVIATE
jgi:ABC-type branched-subunit amino acid transport system substrate-binding protein